MSTLRAANLALAFLIELAGIAAVGYWGFTLDAGAGVRILAGIGTPVLFIAAWAVLGAPRAPVRLGPAARLVFKIVWVGLAALLLALAGAVPLGVLLAALCAVNLTLARVWRQG